MEMKVNFLPSETWNFLKMNFGRVRYEGSITPFEPEIIKGENIKEEIPSYFDSIKTGMGGNMTELTKAMPPVMIRSSAVINYNYRDKEQGGSRLYIDAPEGAVLDVVLCFSSEAESCGISALTAKIHAGKNSRVNIYSADILGKGFIFLNDTGIEQEEDSEVRFIRLDLGGKELYEGTEVLLKGDRSSFKGETGYHTKTGQKLDINYNGVHVGKKTTSLMEASGSVEEQGEKIFRGTIDLKRGAAGSVGTESENVLLLGDELINKSIPLILCSEEDVEGNHGASIGRIDRKMLFYLASRGIPEKEAVDMIANSRIDAICDKIPHEETRKKIRERNRND